MPEVMPLVWAYRDKPENFDGGSLHILLADGNVKDHHVRWCIDYAWQHGDDDGVELGLLLLGMSKTQRLKVRSRFHERQQA